MTQVEKNNQPLFPGGTLAIKGEIRMPSDKEGLIGGLPASMFIRRKVRYRSGGGSWHGVVVVVHEVDGNRIGYKPPNHKRIEYDTADKFEPVWSKGNEDLKQYKDTLKGFPDMLPPPPPPPPLKVVTPPPVKAAPPPIPHGAKVAAKSIAASPAAVPTQPVLPPVPAVPQPVLPPVPDIPVRQVSAPAPVARQQLLAELAKALEDIDAAKDMLAEAQTALAEAEARVKTLSGQLDSLGVHIQLDQIPAEPEPVVPEPQPEPQPKPRRKAKKVTGMMQNDTRQVVAGLHRRVLAGEVLRYDELKATHGFGAAGYQTKPGSARRLVRLLRIFDPERLFGYKLLEDCIRVTVR